MYGDWCVFLSALWIGTSRIVLDPSGVLRPFPSPHSAKITVSHLSPQYVVWLNAGFSLFFRKRSSPAFFSPTPPGSQPSTGPRPLHPGDRPGHCSRRLPVPQRDICSIRSLSGGFFKPLSRLTFRAKPLPPSKARALRESVLFAREAQTGNLRTVDTGQTGARLRGANVDTRQQRTSLLRAFLERRQLPRARRSDLYASGTRPEARALRSQGARRSEVTGSRRTSPRVPG
jgi:hypothetical protein